MTPTSCLPAAPPPPLGPLDSTPNLIDEYLISVHPAVLAAGPPLFGHLTADLALELIEATPFTAAWSCCVIGWCSNETAADLHRRTR